MHYILSVLAAMAVSVMVLVNGELTAAYDLYAATVIIHVVGLALCSLLCFVRREHVLSVKGLKWAAFMGGAIGVLTTVFNNHAYGKIDVSAIVALGLTGQALSALIVDQLGLFGMRVSRLSRGKVVGLLFAIVGIVWMMAGAAFAPVPVLLSLLTGVTLTLNRYINAQLAARTSALVSTWYNYVVGLLVAALFWAIACGAGASRVPAELVSPIWIYLGGAIGVIIVLQANYSTRHISALMMTLVLFIGQIFAGVALDWLLAGALPVNNLVGGTCVLAGLCLNMYIDAKRSKS